LSTKRRSAYPYFLILPAFAVVCLLAIYPLVTLFNMSLHSWLFGKPWNEAKFIGLENYKELLKINSSFYHSIKISLIYAICSVSVEFFLGLTIALLLSKIKYSSILSAFFIIPLVLTPSMIGMTWRLYFSNYGVVNFFLDFLFKTKINWYSYKMALPAVIIVDIWEYTPFFILAFLSGIQSLPLAPYEAARIDGASGWQILRYVTLPMLAPLILIVVLLRAMDNLRLFDVIFVMFAGGPGDATETLPLFVYKTTLVRRLVGKGAAGSLLLTIIVLVIALIFMRLLMGIEKKWSR